MSSRSLILAQVSRVKDQNVIYPSCKYCYSKVFSQGQGDEIIWKCLKCKGQFPESDINYRFRLHLMITDDATFCDVSVFGRNLEHLFGCTAYQFKNYLDKNAESTDSLLTSAIEEVCVGRFFLFGFKSKPIERRKSHQQLNIPVSLSAVLKHSSLHQNDQDQNKLASLVAYQMLPAPSSGPHVEVPTVLKTLRRKIQAQILHFGGDVQLSNPNDKDAQNPDQSSLSQGGFFHSIVVDTPKFGGSDVENFGQKSVLLSCDKDSSSFFEKQNGHKVTGESYLQDPCDKSSFLCKAPSFPVPKEDIDNFGSDFDEDYLGSFSGDADNKAFGKSIPSCPLDRFCSYKQLSAQLATGESKGVYIENFDDFTKSSDELESSSNSEHGEGIEQESHRNEDHGESLEIPRNNAISFSVNNLHGISIASYACPDIGDETCFSTVSTDYASTRGSVQTCVLDKLSIASCGSNPPWTLSNRFTMGGNKKEMFKEEEEDQCDFLDETFDPLSGEGLPKEDLNSSEQVVKNFSPNNDLENQQVKVPENNIKASNPNPINDKSSDINHESLSNGADLSTESDSDSFLLLACQANPTQDKSISPCDFTPSSFTTNSAECLRKSSPCDGRRPLESLEELDENSDNSNNKPYGNLTEDHSKNEAASFTSGMDPNIDTVEMPYSEDLDAFLNEMDFQPNFAPPRKDSLSEEVRLETIQEEKEIPSSADTNSSSIASSARDLNSECSNQIDTTKPDEKMGLDEYDKNPKAKPKPKANVDLGIEEMPYSEDLDAFLNEFDSQEIISPKRKDNGASKKPGLETISEENQILNTADTKSRCDMTERYACNNESLEGFSVEERTLPKENKQSVNESNTEYQDCKEKYNSNCQDYETPVCNVDKIVEYCQKDGTEKTLHLTESSINKPVCEKNNISLTTPTSHSLSKCNDSAYSSKNFTKEEICNQTHAKDLVNAEINTKDKGADGLDDIDDDPTESIILTQFSDIDSAFSPKTIDREPKDQLLIDTVDCSIDREENNKPNSTKESYAMMNELLPEEKDNLCEEKLPLSEELFQSQEMFSTQCDATQENKDKISADDNDESSQCSTAEEENPNYSDELFSTGSELFSMSFSSQQDEFLNSQSGASPEKNLSQVNKSKLEYPSTKYINDSPIAKPYKYFRSPLKQLSPYQNIKRRKSVHFAGNLVKCKNIVNIDEKMRTTPLPVSHVKLRKSCLIPIDIMMPVIKDLSEQDSPSISSQAEIFCQSPIISANRTLHSTPLHESKSQYKKYRNSFVHSFDFSPTGSDIVPASVKRNNQIKVVASKDPRLPSKIDRFKGLNRFKRLMDKENKRAISHYKKGAKKDKENDSRGYCDMNCDLDESLSFIESSQAENKVRTTVNKFVKDNDKENLYEKLPRLICDTSLCNDKSQEEASFDNSADLFDGSGELFTDDSSEMSLAYNNLCKKLF